MAAREIRVEVPRVWAAAALVVGALVVVSRTLAGPMWGTSWFVALSSVMASGLLARSWSAASGMTVQWRRAVTVLAALVLAYPAQWAVVGLVDRWLPGSGITWGFAVAAGTGHLPIIAACAVFPLFAVDLVGGARTRGAIVVVGLLLFGAMSSLALFVAEIDSFVSEPLVRWPLGEVVAAVLTLMLLATVLWGPIVALRAARSADVGDGRLLSRVALSGLAGVGLVMVCGVVSTSVGVGAIVVLVGMDAAAVAVILGCTNAVGAAGGNDLQKHPRPHTVLSPRESEVLSLLAGGLSNAGIATELFVSERTVDAHVRSIFNKLDLPDGPHDNRRVHAVRAWHEIQSAK